jgi:hypothetical protein
MESIANFFSARSRQEGGVFLDHIRSAAANLG